MKTFDDPFMYIAERLRDEDQREIAATSPGGEYDAGAFIDMVAKANPVFLHTWFLKDGTPCGFCGFSQTGKYALNAWMVGTDELKKLGWRVHRDALIIHRHLAKRGWRRFWSIPLTSSSGNIKWLQRLGYQAEGVFPNHCWTDDDVMMQMAWNVGKPEPWEQRQCAESQLQSLP